jgi:hypothetical protein
MNGCEEGIEYAPVAVAQAKYGKLSVRCCIYKSCVTDLLCLNV